MFAGFNLALNMDDFKQMITYEEEDFEYYKRVGENHLANEKAHFKEKIEDYITNGIADGTKLGSDWFPQIKADLFISHSHKDEDLAMALAGWIYKKLGLICFIDSCVWGYADDLLEIINAEFSNKRKDTDGGFLYSHKKCNTASKHVNVMLCMALQKMIDKVESVFVINTENSISKYEDVYEDATFSPWIYSEIVCTEIVRKKELREYRRGYIEIKAFSESYSQANEGEYKAAYQICLDHLQQIDMEKLITWKVNWERVGNKINRYALDELYKITHPEKMRKLYSLHNIIERI